MWTPISKPTTQGWTNTNPAGRTQYDQSNVTYDDASMFYDGIDPNGWTKPAKPSTSNWTKVSKPS